ncbi:integral membrane protein GPR155-like [Gadus chalcogrammus]|uniref:integral membrane protein GPR155-like n=1 Tax=Gadus chalcogrammus TaxID=1042646 RepID=UPI0024C4AE15|nr:integral membrane protein GPR155-like [Gadus chalcogrammus]
METTSNNVFIHGKNISHKTIPSSVVQHMSIDKLFPALVECFGIILCGYIASRATIITGSQAKGLGNFVSKFALPALLFKNMVLLDFGDVIWAFLWSILIAKVTVFALVCTLTLMVASPDTRYSKAGLYAIFATQSNDFALGYPIVDALYRTTYPEYLQYIYLVAPVSLMFLNPIGFALCEVQRWRQTSGPQRRTLSILGVVVLQVLTNPIVFMVVVGLVSHFALGQKIPLVLVQFIDGLADSFGGAALFYLTMVEQLRKLTRDSGVALIVLITAKLLVMPLICKEMVELLDGGAADSSRANHSSLSNFAFLYGVFPTAPNVALYASQFNMELEVVSSLHHSASIYASQFKMELEVTNELIQLFPQKSGVKRSKGAGTTPLMSQKLMCISLIHFVIIKERPDSQICRLDGYGVGLGITSGQNLASEPLGAGATRWSTC